MNPKIAGRLYNVNIEMNQCEIFMRNFVMQESPDCSFHFPNEEVGDGPLSEATLPDLFLSSILDRCLKSGN